MSNKLISVGVIFGGNSLEHNVSIQSAINVVNALRSKENSEKYLVNAVYIDQNGSWWPSDIAESVLREGLPKIPKESNYLNRAAGFTSMPEGSENVQVWFPVLHGPNGEDGTVQGLLKLMQKPFVGSSVLGSAMAMDKIAMKAAFTAAGLPQVPYIATNSKKLQTKKGTEKLVQAIEKKLNYPCFIKPANLGSSVGITKANNKKQLIDGLQVAASLDNRIVVEKAVRARELECAVLGKETMQASTIGEIIFNSDWYDYETKYSSDSNQTIIPASIPEYISNQIKEMTLLACESVAATDIARVDFFYEETNSSIWINEINTLPGFTLQSMYPMLWKASGIPLETLVGMLVDIAQE